MNTRCNVEVCRICLVINTKMYSLNSSFLRSYYEEIINNHFESEMSEVDDLPPYLCYECASLVKKYYNFKAKCVRGHKILKQILHTNIQITKEAIKKINRKSENLSSDIDFWQSTARILSEVISYNDATYQDLEITVKEPEIVNIHDIKNENNVLLQNDTSNTFDNEFFDCEDSNFKSILDDNSKTEVKIEVDDDFVNLDTIPLSEFVIIEKGYRKKTNTKKERKKKHKTMSLVPDNESDLMRVKKDKQKQEKMVKETDQKKIIANLQTKYMVQRLRARTLNPEYWRTVILTDEQQMSEFDKRKCSTNYRGAPYPCDICYRGFLDEDSFTVHKKHHDESAGQFQCHICKWRHKWISKLNAHMKNHATRFECTRCTYSTFNKGNTSNHEKYHDGVTFKCVLCDLDFRKASSFHTHMRVQHRSQYICCVCGENFLNNEGLSLHKTRMHARVDDDNIEGGVNCAKCDMVFHSQGAYDQHLITSNKHAGETPDRRSYAQKKNSLRNANKPYSKKNELKRKEIRPISKEPRHRAMRSGSTGRTKCEKCGEWFRTERIYVKHFKTAHPEEKPREPYICEVCGITKSVWVNMQMHMLTHGEPKFACKQCDAKFKTIPNLHRHRTVHSGEKHYECRQCGKRFTQSNGMKLHYRTVHLKEPYPKRDRRKRRAEPLDSTDPAHTENKAEFINAYLLHNYT